jgi:AmmeMemoRadiSam system protein A
MGRTLLVEPRERLAERDRQTLLTIAGQSISTGLVTRQPLSMEWDAFSAALRQPRSSFVTLKIGERLRGCMGNLAASRCLVHDVVFNAFAAAFRDPRFSPLTVQELVQLSITVSVLGPFEPLTARTEDDLLQQLRPGVDGVVLTHAGRQATLLPAVWRSVETPRAFLETLKRKARLPAEFWSPDLEFARYTTEVFTQWPTRAGQPSAAIDEACVVDMPSNNDCPGLVQGPEGGAVAEPPSTPHSRSRM